MSYLYIVVIQVIVTLPQIPQARQVLQVVRTPQPLPTALSLKNHPRRHPKKIFLREDTCLHKYHICIL